MQACIGKICQMNHSVTRDFSIRGASRRQMYECMPSFLGMFHVYVSPFGKLLIIYVLVMEQIECF